MLHKKNWFVPNNYLNEWKVYKIWDKGTRTFLLNSWIFLVSPSEILGIEMEDSMLTNIKTRRKRSKAKREKMDLFNPALQAGGKLKI